MLPILEYKKASFAEQTMQSFVEANKLGIIGYIQDHTAELYVFDQEELIYEEHLKSIYVESTAKELKDNFQKASVLLMQIDQGKLNIKKLFRRPSEQQSN